MKRCRHEFTVISIGWDDIGNREVVSHECRQCGEWLPLGPSNDSPLKVQVEICAAEIAVEAAEHGRTSWKGYDYEWYGYLAFQNTPTDAYGLTGAEPGFGAGWLARQIVDGE